MKRDFLKDLGIEDKEVVDKIMAENGKDIEEAKGEKDSLETQLEDLKKEKTKLEESIKDRDKQLKELKDSAGDNEELKKKIDELQTSNKEAAEAHKKEIAALNKTHKVEAAISAARGKNIKAIMPFLDMDKVSLDGDNLIGLNEQLEELKKADDTKFLFNDGKTKMKGAQIGEDEDKNEQGGKTAEEIRKMSAVDRSNYKKEHPDEYEAVMGR